MRSKTRPVFKKDETEIIILKFSILGKPSIKKKFTLGGRDRPTIFTFNTITFSKHHWSKKVKFT